MVIIYRSILLFIITIATTYCYYHIISFHSYLSSLNSQSNMAPVRIMHPVLGNDINSSNAMLKICYNFRYNHHDGTFVDIKDYIHHSAYANNKLRTAAATLNAEYFTNTAARYCAFRARNAFDVLVSYELRARTTWRGSLSLGGTVEQNAALGSAADFAEVPWFVGNTDQARRGEVGVEFPDSFLTCYNEVHDTLLAVEALYELTCFTTVDVEDPEEMHFLCKYLRTFDWPFTVRITGDLTAAEWQHIMDIAKSEYVTVENYDGSSEDDESADGEDESSDGDGDQ